VTISVATSPIELYAVRHGETTWNREGRIQGQKNTPLTSLGQQQAAELRDDLQPISFDQVFSSDLLRCRQTTDILMADRDIPIGYSKRFRERGFGKLEGLLWRDVPTRYPAFKQDKKVLARAKPELGIEDQDTDFRSRVLDGVKRLRRQYSTAARILLVTHGGVIKVLLREAEGRNKTFMVSNCGFYRFKLQGSEIKLLRS
jgi:2,3-bisphosphoglycerate-dependent phosphoglycerate mutase